MGFGLFFKSVDGVIARAGTTTDVTRPRNPTNPKPKTYPPSNLIFGSNYHWAAGSGRDLRNIVV